MSMVTSNGKFVFVNQTGGTSNKAGFVEFWDCATGKPATELTTIPYTYKKGDYYRISNISTGYATFDGDLSKKSASEKVYNEDWGVTFVKVSTEIPTSSILIGSTMTMVYGGESSSGTISAGYIMEDTDSYIMLVEGMAIITKQNNVTVEGVTFPTSGTWVMYRDDEGDLTYVSQIKVSSGTNYIPSGATYSGVASTTTTTDGIQVGSIYYYDGSSWTLQVGTEQAAERTGGYINMWNAKTGTPVTAFSSIPFVYKTGDYYRVSKIDYGQVEFDGDLTGKTTVTLPDFGSSDETYKLVNLSYYSTSGILGSTIKYFCYGSEYEMDVDTSSVSTEGCTNCATISGSDGLLAIITANESAATYTYNTTTINIPSSGTWVIYKEEEGYAVPVKYVTSVKVTSSVTNYMPDGNSYQDSSSHESTDDDIQVGSIYYYNGSEWLLQPGTEVIEPGGSASLSAGSAISITSVSSASQISVLYDDTSVGLTSDNKLEVKDSYITAQISSSVSSASYSELTTTSKTLTGAINELNAAITGVATRMEAL